MDGVCGSVYALAGDALLSVVKVSSGISASAREYPPSQPPPHTLACTHALTPGFCPPIPLLSQFNQSNNQINQSIYQPSTNSSPEEDFSLNYKALFLLKKPILFCNRTSANTSQAGNPAYICLLILPFPGSYCCRVAGRVHAANRSPLTRGTSPLIDLRKKRKKDTAKRRVKFGPSKTWLSRPFQEEKSSQKQVNPKSTFASNIIPKNLGESRARRTEEGAAVRVRKHIHRVTHKEKGLKNEHKVARKKITSHFLSCNKLR